MVSENFYGCLGVVGQRLRTLTPSCPVPSGNITNTPINKPCAPARIVSKLTIYDTKSECLCYAVNCGVGQYHKLCHNTVSHHLRTYDTILLNSLKISQSIPQ